jgi:hypothetical protein
VKDLEELRTVAKRVVWFKPPEESLKDAKLFLAHLMTYGTLKDVIIAMRHFTDEDFDRVLSDPPPGIFDLRSWNYWNLRFHHVPVPPLPARSLVSGETK